MWCSTSGQVDLNLSQAKRKSDKRSYNIFVRHHKITRNNQQCASCLTFKAKMQICSQRSSVRHNHKITFHCRNMWAHVDRTAFACKSGITFVQGHTGGYGHGKIHNVRSDFVHLYFAYRPLCKFTG